MSVWQCNKCKNWNRENETGQIKPVSFALLTLFTFGWYLIWVALKSCMNMAQDSYQGISNQHYCKVCGTRKGHFR